MPYNITHTNGALYASIGDGVVDNRLGLSLIGKNYHNYGELIANNFLRLLENQANDTQPANPIAGQLWWDTDGKVLSFFDGNRFKPCSSSAVSIDAPLVPLDGDQWWDLDYHQLKVFDGAEWLVVGPAYSKGQGATGTTISSVTDTNSFTHIISLLQVNGNTVATISNDLTFIASQPIAGITEVARGITLAPNAILSGTSTNSNQLGGVVAAKYVRTDTDSSVTGSLVVTGTNGVTIGNNGNVKISGDGFGNQKILVQGGSLFLFAGNSTVQLDSVTGELQLGHTGVTTTGVTTKGYVDTLVNTSSANLTSYVNSSISSLVAGSQIATLNALSVAIGDDPSYSINTDVKLSLKANLANPQFTGTPLAPTASIATSSDQIATTAFVNASIIQFASVQSYVAFTINSADPVTGRQLNTLYTNPTNQKIEVVITFSSGVLTVEVAGMQVLSHASANNNTTTSATFSVQPGATYKCSGVTLQRWTELR